MIELQYETWVYYWRTWNAKNPFIFFAAPTMDKNNAAFLRLYKLFSFPMCKTVPEGKQKNSSILHAHVRKKSHVPFSYVTHFWCTLRSLIFTFLYCRQFLVPWRRYHPVNQKLRRTGKCWRRYRESMRILSWLWKLWLFELLKICWCSCDFTRIKSFFGCIQSYTYDVYISLVCLNRYIILSICLKGSHSYVWGQVVKWFPPTILLPIFWFRGTLWRGKMIWQTKSWPRRVMGKALIGVDPVDLFLSPGEYSSQMLFGDLRCYNWKIWRLFFCLWICFPILRILIRPWNRICIKQRHGKKKNTKSETAILTGMCGMC